MRFDSLQARATTLEKVVADARELLLARAEQIREYDRRNGELRPSAMPCMSGYPTCKPRSSRSESKYKEADQTRTTYMERNETLARAFTAKEAALTLAEDANASLADRVRRAGSRACRREASRRAEDRGPRSHVAPRETGACGGGRRARGRPQGLFQGDARSDGAATHAGGASRTGPAARRQRRIGISDRTCRIVGPDGPGDIFRLALNRSRHD